MRDDPIQWSTTGWVTLLTQEVPLFSPSIKKKKKKVGTANLGV